MAEIATWIRRGEVAFTAVVSSLGSTNSCTIGLRGSEVPAYFGDQVSAWIDVGVAVTVIPVGDTLRIIDTAGGTGGVGATYGPELLPNPSFEYGTVKATGWYDYPWVVGNWDTARDTAAGEAYSGTARMRITLAAGGDAPPLARVWNADAVSVDAGKTYRAQAVVKADRLEPLLTVDLRVITGVTQDSAAVLAPGSTALTIATQASPGGAYLLLSGPITIPAGHKFARVYMSAECSAEPASPVVVSWDAASLKQQITS